MENTNNDNTGPWYEQEEVTADYVREHQFKKLKQTQNGKQLDDDILRSILLKHIPDTMSNFGSLRGYLTFGLNANIMREIEKDIKMNC
tara:strand:- start:348 stop:611 length:264 start_codon:yes stop_codon:yes gene_type:complete